MSEDLHCFHADVSSIGISKELEQRLERELTVTLSGYFTEFSANIRNIRIYESKYGLVKPHVDIAVYPEDTHTCLVYLTDEFDGGILTVKTKTDQNHILSHGESHKKHLCVTPEPRVIYGIWHISCCFRKALFIIQMNSWKVVKLSC